MGYMDLSSSALISVNQCQKVILVFFKSCDLIDLIVNHGLHKFKSK